MERLSELANPTISATTATSSALSAAETATAAAAAATLKPVTFLRHTKAVD